MKRLNDDGFLSKSSSSDHAGDRLASQLGGKSDNDLFLEADDRLRDVLLTLDRSVTRSAITHRIDMPSDLVLQCVEQALAQGMLENVPVRLRSFELGTKHYLGVQMEPGLRALLRQRDEEFEAQLMIDAGVIPIDG